MRRLAAMLCALALALTATGCSSDRSVSATDQMIEFYYRQSSIRYDAENGVIASELRSVIDPAKLTDWLPWYLLGPTSNELQSPFPRSVSVVSAQVEDSTAMLVLSEEYATLSGVNMTIANACLTLTLTQLSGIEAVQIEIEGDAVTTQESFRYTASDFVSYDYAAEAVEVSLRLYYSDRSMRYLLSTSRQVESGQSDHLPDYVVSCLIAGPSDDAMQSVMPDGTQLLSSTVSDGVCTLNFNQAFYDNRPESEAEERVLIYSIVNSVTQLSGIQAVRFEIEGETVELYRYLDLSIDYHYNEDAVGPVRTAVNEFDGTVFMTGADPAYLAALPLRVRQSANQTMEEALLLALLEYQPPDGMTNPIAPGTELIGLETDGDVCRVNLSDEFEPTDAAIASIVHSLCSLEEIARVQVLVNGEPVSGLLAPDASWRYPVP